jgi:hypothetical protein
MSGNVARARGGRGRSWLALGLVATLLVLVGVASGVVIAKVGSNAAGTSATNSSTGTSLSGKQPKAPRPEFTVTQVSGGTIAATKADGTAVTITVTSGTAILRAGQPATLADITPGTKLRVAGKGEGSGTITASKIEIVLPEVAGPITAISGSSLTIQAKQGTRVIQMTDSTRLYAAQTNAPLSASALQVGVMIHATGILNSDGSLSALTLVVGQAGTNGSASDTGNGTGGIDGPPPPVATAPPSN